MYIRDICFLDLLIKHNVKVSNKVKIRIELKVIKKKKTIFFNIFC